MLFENTSGKILYLLCGPSAVGKDTLASYTKYLLYLERINYSYVDKYTTRERRGNEGLNSSGFQSEPSGKYEYFKDKDEMHRIKSDIALHYSIYDHYYALAGNHLLSEDIADKYLMCIYGRFENIHSIKKEVFYKYKRMPFAILITASSEDLENRILRRHSMSENEQAKRIKEMKRQIKFVENNNTMISSGFDLIIRNGDNDTVIHGRTTMATFVKKTMFLAINCSESDR